MRTPGRKLSDVLEDVHDDAAALVEDMRKAVDTVYACTNQLTGGASAVMKDATEALAEIRQAAQAHKRAMSTLDAILWSGIAAVTVWLAWDLTRDLVGRAGR